MASPLEWDELSSIDYIAKDDFAFTNLSFHDFSHEWKDRVLPWSWSNDDSVNAVSSVIIGDIGAFLQAWLFFGLLKEVLGDELGHKELFIMDNKINMLMVVTKIEEWKREVLSNEQGRTSRLVRVQMALTEARSSMAEICSLQKLEDGAKDTVPIAIALSIMVLGETLTSYTLRILTEIGARRIRGWHIDDNRGWAETKVLMRTMSEKWSRETVHMLQGSLGGHATAQLYALRMISEQPIRRQNTAENFQDGRYQKAHRDGCFHKNDRQFVGPDEKSLAEIIEKDRIPLVRYSSTSEKVEVLQFEPGTRYAIVSHVWADGYGNELENQMCRCVLEFFNGIFLEAQKLLRRSSPCKELPFWIDTLTIPVKNVVQRKKAIKTMHHAYTNADFTIVLDSGLDIMEIGDSYSETAIKIFASRWMGRLWTLQEAYLSKKLVFKFRLNELVDLDQLEGSFLTSNTVADSMVAGKARRYFDRLLGWQRQMRIYSVPRNDIVLLASVWEAVQWRTTARAIHESQALATLFQIEVDFPDDFNHLTCGSQCGKEDGPCRDNLDKRMKNFLECLYDAYPNSIPPGIIFLPGRRLSIEGFGWAPNTWMVGQNIRRDHPVFTSTVSAELTLNGLVVRYPGFLLRSFENPDYVFDKFVFASDIWLLEWYHAQVDGSVPDLPVTGNLAIISSQEDVREDRVIALLVQIKKRRHPKLHVEIMRRIWIWRERDQSTIKEFQKRFWEHRGGAGWFGEVLAADQLWCIGRGKWDPERLSESSRTTTGNILPE